METFLEVRKIVHNLWKKKKKTTYIIKLWKILNVYTTNFITFSIQIDAVMNVLGGFQPPNQ